jgi:hypothetical protein
MAGAERAVAIGVPRAGSPIPAISISSPPISVTSPMASKTPLSVAAICRRARVRNVSVMGLLNAQPAWSRRSTCRSRRARSALFGPGLDAGARVRLRSPSAGHPARAASCAGQRIAVRRSFRVPNPSSAATTPRAAWASRRTKGRRARSRRSGGRRKWSCSHSQQEHHQWQGACRPGDDSASPQKQRPLTASAQRLRACMYGIPRGLRLMRWNRTCCSQGAGGPKCFYAALQF